MMQNEAALKGQSAPEPGAAEIEEPYPAEPPPPPDAPDVGGAGAAELHAPVPLTPKQMLAFPYIVSAPSLSKAAEAAQVGRASLTRWMQDPRFRAEVERAREEVADLALAEIRGLAFKSVVALADLLEDPSPNIRNYAVRTALHSAFKAKDQAETRRSIAQLENALAQLKNQK